MSREIITYVRMDGAVSTLVDVDNKDISQVLAKIPVIYLTEQATGKIRLIHINGTPYSLAEVQVYTGFDFGITEDFSDATVAPIRTQTGITVAEESWTDTAGNNYTGGVIVVPIDANTIELQTVLGIEPYVFNKGLSEIGKIPITVGSELLGYISPELEPSLIVQFPYVFVNRRITSDTPPGTIGVDYITPAQANALYISRSASNIDTGALLNSDDYFIALNKDTGLSQKYLISDINLGIQVPPVQNTYADIATMLIDQGNQTLDYIQQAGTNFYKKKATTTASESDYDSFAQEQSESILSIIDADFTAGVRAISAGEIGSILSIDITAPTGSFAIEMPDLVGTERNIKTTVNYLTGAPTLDVTTTGGTQLIGGLTTQSLLEEQRIEIANNGTAYDLTNDDRGGAGIGDVTLDGVQTLTNKSLTAVKVTDYVDFTPQGAPVAHTTGRFYYDAIENSFIARNDISDVSLNVGEEMWGRVFNDNAFTLTNGKCGYVKGSSGGNLTCGLTDSSTLDTSVRALGIFTNDILAGAEGYITTFGEVRDVDTSMFTMGDILYADPENIGELINIRPKAPFYSVRVGICLFSSATVGVIGVDTLAFNGSDTSVNIEGSLNGVVIETPEVNFYESGGLVYAEILNQDDNTKNLNFIQDGMRYTVNTTTAGGPNGGAYAQLTYGADAQTLFENFLYVWLNGSTPEFKISTIATPDLHAPIGYASLYDSVRTLADGEVDTWRRYNDAPDNGVTKGQTRRVNDAIRNKLGTTYYSGVDGTTTVTNASVLISTTTGVALQANFQAVGALNGTSYIVYNDATNAATKLEFSNLASIVQTSAGGTLAINGIYYRLKVYIQCTSPSGGLFASTAKFIVTRPSGSYDNSADAINDINNYDTNVNDLNIEGLIFPHSTIVIGRTGAAGGTWTEIETQDNRSRLVGGGGGGGGAAGAAGTDELVKASATDTTANYLTDKIASGTGIVKTILNPAGNEQIEVKLADTSVTPGAYTKADITIDAQGRITSAANGSAAAINGYTPPAGTVAKVNTDPLLANTSTNTFAGDIDGTVYVSEAPSNGEKFWLYLSGLATVEVRKVTSDALVATVTKANGTVCIEYDTVSASYTVTRTNDIDSAGGGGGGLGWSAVSVKTTSYTIVAGDSGTKISLGTAATGTNSFTLPTTPTDGFSVSLENQNAFALKPLKISNGADDIKTIGVDDGVSFCIYSTSTSTWTIL